MSGLVTYSVATEVFSCLTQLIAFGVVATRPTDTHTNLPNRHLEEKVAGQVREVCLSHLEAVHLTTTHRSAQDCGQPGQGYVSPARHRECLLVARAGLDHFDRIGTLSCTS